MKIRDSLSAIVTVLGPALFAAVACAQQPAAATITVSTAERHQRIVGWEATAEAADDNVARFLKFRDPLFDGLVNDLGISRLRLEVRSGGENVGDAFGQFSSGLMPPAAWRARRYATVNDNTDPAVINWDGFSFSELDRDVELIVNPIRARVERAGGRLTVNLCYVAFTDQIGPGGQYHHGDPAEYGEYIEAVWRHMQQKYGWVPDGLEVILEPDNVRQWNGTLVGRAIVETARRLSAAGFAVPRFIAPSTTSMAAAATFFDDMIKVDGVAGLLSELSYHRYRGVSEGNLRALQHRGQQYGIATAMLEWIGATHETLHEDLKIGGNSAWAQFVIAGMTDDSGGRYYVIDGSDPANPTFAPGARTRFLRQYFKFIRPGATRVGAGTSNPSMDPLAFENADGGVVVVVKCDQPGTLTLSGLPPGTYGISFSTTKAPDQAHPDQTIRAGEPATTSIPAPGVITVYARR